MHINKVVFITIDSLRNNRLGVADYHLPLTPTLDRLAQEGIYCHQTVSPASCTQMAHPTIWTSTLPLDYGGYDTGIMNRPVSLVELFQQQGFRTVGFSDCFFLGHFFGYTRGFDTVYPLYNPRRSWHALYQNYFSHYLKAYQTHQISAQTLVAQALPLLQKELQFLIELGQQQQRLLQAGLIAPNPLLDQTPFARLEQFCLTAQQKIAQGGLSYFLEHLNTLLTPTLFQQAGLSASPKPVTYREQAFDLVLNRLRHTFLYPFAIARWNQQKSLTQDTTLLINGAYMVQTAINWVQQNPTEKLFLWVALGDIHELIGGTTSLPNPFQWPTVWLERLRQGQPHPGSFLYDLAVKYEDTLIDRLLQALQRQWGHLDDVLVVICADHGRQWWMDGQRTQRSQRSTLDFYEEDVRVPLIFWHPHLEPQRIAHLCGLLDLAPTLIDLMGWPSEPAFQGLPVYSTAAQTRPYLILEDAGRGPCNLTENALRISLRTPSYKYIWQAAGTNHAERNELYDLAQDPKETLNLYATEAYQMMSQELKRKVQQRNQVVKQSAQQH